jgi:hypothetical protein
MTDHRSYFPVDEQRTWLLPGILVYAIRDARRDGIYTLCNFPQGFVFLYLFSHHHVKYSCTITAIPR